MCVTPTAARQAVEMLTIIMGSREELRRRPIYSAIQCTMSPLGHDQGSLEAALILADAGLPVGFMGMPMSVASAPATIPGNLIVNNAEVISATAMIQMANPGSPVFYASAPTVIDLRTGGYTGGSPEDYLLGGSVNQLADFYNLPSSMGAMATGAKWPDWQAAVDNSLSTLAPLLTKTDLLSGAGMLNGSKILSLQELVMDEEIWGIIKKLAEGFTVDDETMAVDVIKEVGIGGTFLAHRHTRKWMRELWQPTVWDRTPYSVWAEGGRRGAFEAATAKAKKLLAEHQPPALDPAVRRELDRFIRTAEAELLKKAT